MQGLSRVYSTAQLRDCAGLWQVAALGDMRAAGHAPDLFTFTALINACQRANEAELAFEVLKCAAHQTTATSMSISYYIACKLPLLCVL